MTKTEEPYNFCDNIEKDNLMLAAESSWRGIISSALNPQLQGTNYNPMGKYYARVETKQTLDLKKLAKHMHQHNTAFLTAITTTSCIGYGPF